ncbi:hypothetical protein Tco_0302745 [Tanacetum coccineum]
MNIEPFNLEEPIENQAPPVVTMVDQRTMAQLLQAPTEGYEEHLSTSSSTPGVSPDVAKLKDMVRALLLDKKNQSQAPATVKAVEESCVTCGEYSPNNDLIYTIPEMFTDEHTLDYLYPPRYDDSDDDLFDLKTDNDKWEKILYEDPFDSKENKIKDSKLLVDELDSPGLSSFLPHFLESDSVLYEDFTEVDTLTSTDNEDKVFNPGILFHKNLYEVTNRVTPNKNVKKISSSNASLILEDYNPLISDHELPFHIEIPRITPDYESSRAHGLSIVHSSFTSAASLWESNILILSTNVYL